ncbi:hypothetical protein [Bacillus sp. Hm123]|uniref:hypothetical protein n=1 Tax=Bacillus sp. Hm123 TaxID=3450745 RepID=UPI003F422639
MKDFLANNPKVSTLCEIVAEYEVTVGEKTIKVKIKRDSTGFYSHSTSHFYQGPEQAGPYISSRNIFDTKGEAIDGAIKQITYFYNESHEYPEDNWIVNSNY